MATKASQVRRRCDIFEVCCPQSPWDEINDNLVKLDGNTPLYIKGIDNTYLIVSNQPITAEVQRAFKV